MSEDRPKSNGPSDPAQADGGAVDLSTVRSARGLAQALEDPRSGAECDQEALRGAAQLVAGASPALSDEARDRLGDELLGPRSVVARGRRFRMMAIAAAILVGAGAALLLRPGPVGKRLARTPEAVEAPVAPDELRDRARALVVSLMPPGGSPRGRALAMADDARARLRSLEDGGAQ